MAAPMEESLQKTLEAKIAALEQRLIELELRSKTTPLTEAALVLNEAIEKKKKEDAEGSVKTVKDDKKGDEGEREGDETTSRVKVIIINRDPETGEPIEKEKKVSTSKEVVDADKFAFILRKNVYENKFLPDHLANGSEIDILNKDLWALLRKHLGHFPYHIFREDPVTIQSPYDYIVYQFDELLVEANRAEEDEENKQARTDLGLLLETIRTSSGDEKLDKYFKMRPNYKKPEPNTIQFEDLWTVFPPGTLVYGRPFLDEPQVFVVKDNQQFWPWRSRTKNEPMPWKLDAWSYDWKDGNFKRTLFTLVFEPFEGHLPLTSLSYYPFELVANREKIRETLIKRGKDFRRICAAEDGNRLYDYRGSSVLESKGFSGMKHDSESSEDVELRTNNSFHWTDLAMLYQGRLEETEVPTVKSVDIQSRVMVDYDSYFQYGRADGRNGPLKPSQGGSGCACSDCQDNEGLATRYRMRFDESKYSNPKEAWEDEQYMLCPPRVLGYILQQKQWAQLRVTELLSLQTEHEEPYKSRLKLADDETSTKNPKFKQADDRSTKTLLLNLVSTHASVKEGKGGDPDEDEENKLEVNDIISGKGKGLVILLYGPPGVGKTSTAETIAIATRKPLFSISVADVGTNPKNVEANLQRVFDLATKWQAILLIDEADVFLESRGRGNAIRSTDKNALVSVFLRVLEYYQGIMFLTTNQIAEFDIAIPSRIHVAIKYEFLKEKQMQAIFHNFLDEVDAKGLIDDYDDIKAWLEEDVYGQNFDGRQIRNIVTIALSLARADKKNGRGGTLRKIHLKRAFANVAAFKKDFDVQMQRYIDSQHKMIK